jgi:hypothetical protein
VNTGFIPEKRTLKPTGVATLGPSPPWKLQKNMKKPFNILNIIKAPA